MKKCEMQCEKAHYPGEKPMRFRAKFQSALEFCHANGAKHS